MDNRAEEQRSMDADTQPLTVVMPSAFGPVLDLRRMGITARAPEAWPIDTYAGRHTTLGHLVKIEHLPST